MIYSNHLSLKEGLKSKKFRKYLKILICIICILIPLIGFDFSVKADTTLNFEPGNLPFHNPTPGRITIMASTPIPSTIHPTRRAYEDLVDCGFNLCTFSGDEEYIKQQFALAEGLDLKLLIKNLTLYTDQYKKIVDRYRNYPSFGGWNFYDEPTYAKLDEIKRLYERLHNYDPDNLIFINLIGMKIDLYTGPSKDMTQYLNLIQKMFHPALWSYDLYPFYQYGKDVKLRCDQFFQALEVYSEMAKKTSRPFWAYCQSMAFKTKSLQRPVAKEEYLRFTNFSFLAYGAQGILYWTYGQRPSTDDETYISALVDLNGKKTKAWYAAQKVNREIIKFNDVFYGCDVSEVKHTGKTHYEGTTQLKGKFGPFESVITEDVGALFSRLSSNGKEYVVIVNHDVNKVQKIKLTLAPNQKVKRLTDNKKATQTGNTLQFQLEKGGWAIFEIGESV